jgi:hypothetical protein
VGPATTAAGFYRRSEFRRDQQRPSDLVIAVLAPAAYRAERGAVGNFGHDDTKIAGALGTSSREVLCQLRNARSLHIEAREQDAHHEEKPGNALSLGLAPQQFDNPRCQTVNHWQYLDAPVCRLTHVAFEYEKSPSVKC